MAGGVKTTLTSIEKKLDSLIQTHETFSKLVNKHETELYGKAAESGEKGAIGLVRRMDAIGDKLDWMQRFALAIWTGVFAIIQIAIGFFKHRAG